MRIGVPCLVAVLAVAVAVPMALDADSTSASARSEVRLQLADLLVDDDRHWEAVATYHAAKTGAKPDQLRRASAGLVRSLLRVAEFTAAYEEAQFLLGLGPTDPRVRTLHADALWAFGLFQEAETVYRDVLAVSPDSAGAHHGLARNLAGRGRLDESLVEIQAALAGDDRAEFYHTLGAVYRQMRQYPDAADAFEQYLNRLPNVSRGDRVEWARSEVRDKVEWARSEVRFLRSFAGRRPLEIEAGQQDQVHTIPFRLVSDKVVIRGRINGQAPIDIVIDTGAEQMVLSSQTAQQLGMRPITKTVSAGVGDVGFRGLELGLVDSLEVGTLRIQNLPATIKNPPLLGLPTRRVRDSISPLAFGLSAVLDYKSHRLILARRLRDEPAGIELPMQMNRLVFVRGVINQEHPKSFAVDTGGEVISISLAAAKALWMAPPVRHIPLQVFGTSGWDPHAFLLPGVDLAFNQIRYENFSVVVLNLHRPSALLGFHIGGIVGHKFLSNYRVAFDLERATLRLTRL